MSHKAVGSLQKKKKLPHTILPTTQMHVMLHATCNSRHPSTPIGEDTIIVVVRLADHPYTD